MRVVPLLAFCAFLFLAPAPVVAQERIGTNCDVDWIDFAPCPGTPRLFRSIIVGIPGWNGKCDSTFGVADGNVLNVMRDPSFFDVDCFDYDSHGMTLAQSEQLLREHLLELQALGYEEVSFITHSTGGVLALKLLLDELTADGTAIRTGADRSFLFRRDGGSLRLRAVYAWGIPINGIRPGECLAGAFANLFGFSTAVLPHLCADSPFLLNLKSQLVGLNALMDSLPDAERKSFGYDLFLFQGQGSDWVVNNIEIGETWFPTNAKLQLVNTSAPHTSVISNNGTIEFPTFSGLTMTELAQLTFTLLPRTSDYFAETLAPSETLDKAQAAILDGVVEFADIGNLFLAGSRQVSSFTVMLFNNRFVRSPAFDASAVAKLDTLLRSKVTEIEPEDAVRYADTLLSDIDRGYQTVNSSDQLSFGGQSKTAVRQLVDTVSFVFGAVKQLIAQQPVLENDLIVSQTVPAFEKKVENVLARLMRDQDEITRTAAVMAMGNFTATATPEALASFDFDASFGAYGRANYAKVTAAEKAIYGDALLAFSARSPDTRSQTLRFLTETRPFLGVDAPMWAPLLNSDQLQRLVQSGDQSVNESQPQWPVFLGQVIGNAGRFGQSVANGALAVEQFRPILEEPTPLQDLHQQVFVESLSATPFPSVRNDGVELLNDLNLSSGVVVQLDRVR